MKHKYLATGIFALLLTLLFIYSFTPAYKGSLPAPSAKSASITFIESDFKKAIAEAKKQNKPLFIDLYATWCGPCKQLKKTSFADKDAATFFNGNFINVSVDVDKGQGPDLAKTYQVTALPTLIVADTSGNVILYTQGYVNAKQLVEFGKDAISKTK